MMVPFGHRIGSLDPSVAFRQGYSVGLAPPLVSNMELETASHVGELGLGEPRSKALQPGPQMEQWRISWSPSDDMPLRHAVNISALAPE
jgi:hypothetical protein